MLKIKILPITFEIVTDEYAENKNPVGYYFKCNRQDFYFQHIRSVTISKVIGKIFIFSIFVGYYIKSNRQEFYFQHIRRLLFQK